jgi:hypothetical protein
MGGGIKDERIIFARIDGSLLFTVITCSQQIIATPSLLPALVQ